MRVRNSQMSTRAALVALLFLASACESATRPTRMTEHLVIESACDEGANACEIDEGAERIFSAFVEYADGSRTPQSAAWSSENTVVASVDNEGRVRGLSSGRTWVRARVGSLVAAKLVRVVPVVVPVEPKIVVVPAWREFVIRRCTATESFDPVEWCSEFYRVGERSTFVMSLTKENGRLTGGIDIDGSGSDLIIDSGTLDADGQLQLTASGSMSWFVLEGIDLKAKIQGNSLEGSFVLTRSGHPGSGLDGSVIVDADLEGVRLE